MTHSAKPTLEQRVRYPEPNGKFKSRPYDLHNLYVSLKQWRILHAVIDCGGFAEAAKSLHLSQSTISYTVSRLQENLGIALLKAEGRKAVLTAEGRALLSRSRQVLKEAIDLESYARDLGCGRGGDVRLMVDHNFPNHMLMQALNRFMQHSAGKSQVTLQQLAVLEADGVLRDASVDLVISECVPLGFLGEPLIEIEYLPVAHREHPLLALGRDVNGEDLARQTRIDIGHPGSGERPRTADAAYTPRWIMNSFDSALAATLERLGYAWLPAHRIGSWLEQGTLRVLPLADKRVHQLMLYLIHGRTWSSSPAIGRMAEMLRAATLGDPAPDPPRLN